MNRPFVPRLVSQLNRSYITIVEPMPRFYFWILIFGGLLFQLVQAQPRIKGKKLDTTQAVLGTDTTLSKLVELKDSLTKIGPKSDLLKEAEPADNTGMFLLILVAVLVIVWAGRRAWKRRGQ